MSVLNHLITKISDVNFTDLNYELGKAKENIVCESGNYIGNFKTDASMVSNLIKTESSRLNETYFDGKIKLPTIQKSLSLPQLNNVAQNIQDFRGKGDSLQQSNSYEKEKESSQIYTNTVRDFERSFLESVSETEEEEEEYVPRNDSRHMQMCFIDEDDSGDDLIPVDGGKHFNYFDVEIEDVEPKLTVKQTIQKAKEVKVKNLQMRLKSALTLCSESATKEAMRYKIKLIDENPLVRLLGIQKDNWELLEDYETDVLKDTIAELKAKISEYNNELVNLIEEKDTLEQYREEIIVDIKDLSSIV